MGEKASTGAYLFRENWPSSRSIMSCLWSLIVAESGSDACGLFYCDDIIQGRITLARIDGLGVDNGRCHCLGQVADVL